MLQPLSPMTILRSDAASSTSSRPRMPLKTHRTSHDVKLQCQFHDLVNLSDHEEVEDFLARHLEKLDVNQFNGDGRTALQQSCLEGNLPMAKVLVKYGANARLTTRDGFSTFHLAVFSGHSTLMGYILSL